jgi:hypothetical protein
MPDPVVRTILAEKGPDLESGQILGQVPSGQICRATDRTKSALQDQTSVTSPTITRGPVYTCLILVIARPVNAEI